MDGVLNVNLLQIFNKHKGLLCCNKIKQMATTCSFGRKKDLDVNSICVGSKTLVDRKRNINARSTLTTTLEVRKDAVICGNLELKSGNLTSDTLLTDCITASVCDEILIDDFSTPQPEVTTSGVGTDETGISSGNIFGGTRRTFLENLGPIGADVIWTTFPADTDGVLAWNSDAITSANVYITYDGSTTGGDSVDGTGLGGLDITENNGEKFCIKNTYYCCW